jgi:hypothetical protein
MEISIVYDKSGQIDDAGSKSIETALKVLHQPLITSNRKVNEKRIRLIDQTYNAIPTRSSPLPPPKIDTRNLFAQRSLSPSTTVSTSWNSAIPTSVTSNPTFDFNFMRTGRLSSGSTAESVASSFDPGSAWTPTPLTDRFSTSPEVESSKNDILEAFLSTIVDDPYTPSQSLENSAMFNLHVDSPTQPGMIMPTLFDWNHSSSFSDEDSDPKVFGTSPSDVSPTTYVPMFLGSYSSEETSPPKFEGYKGNDVYGFKDSGYTDGEGNSHIHTAPNLFSEETGWAV